MTVKSTESGVTLRGRLSRSIVLAIRRLMQQGSPTDESLDMAAFVVLALEKIEESVDLTAQAWEKRDYWLKADHFRQEWAWVARSRKVLVPALLLQDWGVIAPEMINIGQHLNTVQISPNNRIGEPWHGAWAQFTGHKQ